MVFERLETNRNLFISTGAWAREMARWGKVECYGISLTQNISDEIDYMGNWYLNQFSLVDAYINQLNSNSF